MRRTPIAELFSFGAAVTGQIALRVLRLVLT